MGADALADEAGLFTIEIRDYRTGGIIGTVSQQFPDPHHPIAIEILAGRER